MFMPALFTDNFVDRFFDGFDRPAFRTKATDSSLMKTDVIEKEDGFQISIDLPGYKKENVSAELKDGYMTVTATTSSEKENKGADGRFVRRERFYGTCQRSFYVGDVVKEDDIKAKFEDGVLILSVPKKEKQPEVEEKKYIAIE